jgi:hypothetical protein
MPGESETGPDFTLLPSELQPLAKLIRDYGIGDDIEREKAVVAASPAELDDMVTAVAPHWQVINAFLDENMQPPGSLQDVAVALGDLAQAAMEADLERQGRQA